MTFYTLQAYVTQQSWLCAKPIYVTSHRLLLAKTPNDMGRKKDNNSLAKYMIAVAVISSAQKAEARRAEAERPVQRIPSRKNEVRRSVPRTAKAPSKIRKAL